MKYFIGIFLFLLYSSCAVSQTTKNTTNKKALKWFEKAQEYLQARENDKAIDALENALKEDDQFIEPHLILGDLYFRKEDFPKTLQYMQAVIDMEPEKYKKPWYVCGQVHMLRMEYEKALPYFNTYLTFDRIRDDLRAKVASWVKDCEFAMVKIQSPHSIEPINLGPTINTSNDEWLPVTTADQEKLIYTTRFPNGTERVFEGIGDGIDWSNTKQLGPEVNNSKLNVGACCISPDGHRLYFAMDYGRGRENYELYYCNWTGYKWSMPNPVGLPVNSPDYESQPFISADGRSLYFCSRRPGGFGGKDIWMSQMGADGRWEEPVNLGGHINTPGNEEVPFIHPDGRTLYFGSDGHPGFGGTDIYMCRMDALGIWGAPENLGYPINTVRNEGSLFVSADGSTAYFTSDALEGYGGYDLYRFSLPESIRPDPVTYVKAKVYDKETGKPLQANVVLEDVDAGKQLATATSDSVKGEFLVCLTSGRRYRMSVSKPHYAFFSQHYALVEGTPEMPFVVEIPLSPIKSGTKMVLPNIFFDTDSFRLKRESFAELNELLELLRANPRVRIEIGGHTDNQGEAGYNKKLSQRRANSVYDFLLRSGIAADRLSAVGYGAEQPVADNSTAEGRALNRRTEVTFK